MIGRFDIHPLNPRTDTATQRGYTGRRLLSRRHVAALAVVAGALAAGCGAGAASTPLTGGAGTQPAQGSTSVSGLTRKNEAAQVTVEVTPAAPPAPGSALAFRVVLDTHSVDLDGYDLARLAALRVDGGREVPPSAWTAPKGGHHRDGTLAFPAVAGDAPAIPPGARTVVLVIRDIAGVAERSFAWTL